MIQCDIFHGPDSILSYEEAWTQLSNNSESELSTSFDWTQALILTSLQKSDTFLLAILKDGGEIFGIVPLVIRASNKLGVSINHLFPISEFSNIHSDLLMHRNRADQGVACLFTALAESGHNWDVFEMSRILEANPIVTALDGFLRSSSYVSRIEKTEPSFFLTLTGDFSAYLSNRSKKFRANLRRYENKLKAAHRAEVRTHEDFENIEEAYDQIMQIERKSWKNTHGTAIASTANQSRFYEEICRAGKARGWLYLMILYLDELPAAYILGLVKKGTCAGLKASFDDEYRALSLSHVLRARCIERLIHDQIQHVDFSAEPYEWEHHWADQLRWHKSVKVYNNTTIAKIFRVYGLIRSMVKKTRLRHGKILYHDPREV